MSVSNSTIIPKSLYTDVDGRLNLCDLEKRFGENSPKNVHVEKLAKSVGCLALKQYFKDRLQIDGEWSLNDLFFKGDSATLRQQVIRHYAKGEVAEAEINFKDEPCIGNGTAFLIGKDLALTAAHCIFEKKPHQNIVVEKHQAPRLLIFDYIAESKLERKHYPKTFEHRNVYLISSVLAYKYGDADNQDWAILKLDRAVEGRTPLKINFFPELVSKKEVWMIGHPRGLPMKWAGDSTIQNIESKRGPHYFDSNLAGFEGGSGSPVFMGYDSNEVTGMLCYGHTDYSIKKSSAGKNVIRANRPSDEDISYSGYEHSLKMKSLSFLKAALESIDLDHPQNIQYKPGLSMEGICRKCKEETIVTVSRGFPPKKVDIGMACSEVCCPHCMNELDFDDVNFFILSECTYTISAMNENCDRVEETFHLHPLNEKKGVMRFDVRKWLYIVIKVSKLQG